MHIGGPGGQVQDLAPRHADLQVAWLIGKRHQRVGVGDVERVADQRHAIGRIETGEKRRLRFGAAIAIGVAQQGDAIGRWIARASLRHQIVHHALDDPVLGPGRAVGFRHQYVAIGQAQHGAGMGKAIGKAHHAKTLCRNWLFPAGPWLHLGDIDRRDHLAAWPGDGRFAPRIRAGRQLRRVPLREIQERAAGQREDDEGEGDQMLVHAIPFMSPRRAGQGGQAGLFVAFTQP